MLLTSHELSFYLTFSLFFEAPVGKPITTVGKLFFKLLLIGGAWNKMFLTHFPSHHNNSTHLAHNTSSTSVRISWKPPPTDTIHGEFLGYRITYRARDKQAEDIKEIYIRDSSVEVCVVINLSYEFVFYSLYKKGIKQKLTIKFLLPFTLFIFFVISEPWNYQLRDIHSIPRVTASF